MRCEGAQWRMPCHAMHACMKGIPTVMSHRSWTLHDAVCVCVCSRMRLCSRRGLGPLPTTVMLRAADRRA